MCSSFGGVLILIIGILYIAFEKQLLTRTAPAKEIPAAEIANDGVSRAILGAQVSGICGAKCNDF